MQKMSLVALKLTEISRFQNLVKMRFHVTLVYKNCNNSLNIEATAIYLPFQGAKEEGGRRQGGSSNKDQNFPF